MGDFCPPWLSFILDNPLRKRGQPPERVLGPFVQEGATVGDVGCGPGYFTVPMAEMVGPKGRVIAVDLQQSMLNRTRKAAERKGVADRIDFRLCSKTDLRLEPELDFLLAFAVIHEMPDQKRALDQMTAALRPGGRLLIAEPKLHVSNKRFHETVSLAESAGLYWVENYEIAMSFAAVLRRA